MHFRLLTSALLLVALAAPATAPAVAQDNDCTGHVGPVRIFVNVEGLRSNDGLVAVTVYADDSKRFLAKRGSLYVGRIAAHAPTTRICVYLPHTGVFALAAYHDRNANRHFDRTGLGLPGEPYGFSNNPSTLFGLPSFSSVRLNVSRTGQSTTIKLKNP